MVEPVTRFRHWYRQNAVRQWALRHPLLIVLFNFTVPLVLVAVLYQAGGRDLVSSLPVGVTLGVFYAVGRLLIHGMPGQDG